MRSLGGLRLLIVLLVLLPACVLAWIGFRSASLLDAEVAARVGRELDEAERLALERAAEEARLFDEALQARVDRAARKAALVLPFCAPAAGLARVRETLLAAPEGDHEAWCREGAALAPRPPVLADLRLVDDDGRGLLPPEYVPADEEASGSSWGAVLDGLRRRADRARFESGAEAAQRIWEDAGPAMPTAWLQATADVERALHQEDAAGAVRALEARWGVEELLGVGRPAVRLWLRMAQVHPEAPLRLGHLWRDGSLDGVPLTAAERHAVLSLDWLSRGVSEVPPFVTLRAPVRGGVRLEAAFLESSLWSAFTGGMRRQGRYGNVSAYLSSPGEEGTHGPARLAGIDHARFLEGPAWGGRTVQITLVHGAVPGFVEAIRARRRWTTLGILALLLLMTVGVVVVTRAVRRERDARTLRDDFIANVSHELRTPLTSVCLHAEMLAEGDPPPERRRELARVVEAEGRRLAALVDDLLDFAALERGARRIEPEPVDLAQAARAAAAPYAILARRDGVALTVTAPPGERPALADPEGLARILANLLSNAWRHGRPSRDGAAGRIEVRVYDGEVPRVEVRDDGRGIALEERSAIFERFRRGRRAGGTAGTGLGLALGRELARAMGGDLEIVDDETATVFRLTLSGVPDGERP